MSKPAEQAIARILIAWLKAGGWEIYEEVKFRNDPDDAAIWVADIVATRHGVVAVFELKTAYGLPVMRQAERWVNSAHQIFVVVPGDGTAANVDHAYGYRKLDAEGIGVIHIRKHSKLEVQMAQAPGGVLPPPEELVLVAQAAATSRCSAARLEGELREEHKNGAFARAGAKGGDRVSQTNLTKTAIAAHVAARGGVASVSDTASATGTKTWLVTKWAQDQAIKGIALDTSASEIMLRAVDPGNEQPITATSHKLHPPRYIPR